MLCTCDLLSAGWKNPSDTRVVLLSGPGQSEKLRSPGEVAAGNMPFLTPDDGTTLDTARKDPVGLITDWIAPSSIRFSALPRVVLAIKCSVDSDKRNTGRPVADQRADSGDGSFGKRGADCRADVERALHRARNGCHRGYNRAIK